MLKRQSGDKRFTVFEQCEDVKDISVCNLESFDSIGESSQQVLLEAEGECINIMVDDAMKGMVGSCSFQKNDRNNIVNICIQ